MCGIAGIASSEELAPDDSLRLRRMMHQLRHRGPDGDGSWQDSQCALGHRRLAILDLETGRQPIANESGRIHAVVNGEIYNFQDLREQLLADGHQFSTAGDSETAVHLYEDYGEGFLEHLGGMFALALWDSNNRRLILARDRLGVKPLYWHFDGHRLVFGSELKSILAAGIDEPIDETAILDYLTYGFIASPKSIFKKIFKLPAGNFLVFEDGRVSVREYWDLRFKGFSQSSADEAGERLWDALRGATRARMIADVPIGAFVSGGLDSSSVVACMSELSRDSVTTLTCGFEDSAHDESEFASSLAKRFGCTHSTELIRPDAAGVLDQLAWHFDEPFADSSAIAMYYISQAARRHATVILSGDGGDELLAGYRRYRFDHCEQIVRRILPAWFRERVFGAVSRIYPAGKHLPRYLRARATLRNLAQDGATGHGLSIATMDPALARGLLSASALEAVSEYDSLDLIRATYDRCDAPDHLSQCQYVDIKLGLADGILTKVDRASMAHGVEVRSPMLDYRFAELAWTVAPQHRIHGSHGKYPLRIAASRRIGPTAAGRTKHGFEVPMASWFRGGLGEIFQERLIDGQSPVRDLLKMNVIGQVLDLHRSRSQDAAPTLWKILMLDAWMKQLHAGFANSNGPCETMKDNNHAVALSGA